MAKKKSTNPDDHNDLDAIYAGVMNCESAIPVNEMARLADLVMNQERVGRSWRLTALLASKGGEFFRDVAEDAAKAQALAAAVGPLNDFEKLLRMMADLAGCVSARLLVAGCNHEKFNEWAGSADAEFNHG